MLSRSYLLNGCQRLTALLWLALWLPVQAAETVPSASALELLDARLQQAQRDDPARQKLLAEGRSHTEFCARCHGEDGNSKEPLVPNLAGQSARYLLEQIERFADGRRKDYIMSPLARQYRREDRATVAWYYASMSPRPQPANPAQIAQGAVLYGQYCIACHGQGAHGSEQYARLAGQHPAYLKRRLSEFQAASGASVSPMTEIARTLKDRDIEQLAGYLSSLP